MAKSRLKSALSTFLKLAIAGGILYWLSQQGKLNFTALKSLFVPHMFLLGFFLVGGSFWAVTERWKVLLETQGVHVGHWALLKLTFIGVFFNFAMPGGVGGDLIKAYYFYRDHREAKVAAVSSVLVDRLLGLFTLVFMAVTVMIYDYNHIAQIGILFQLFIFFTALFLGFASALFILFTQNHFIQKSIHRLIGVLPQKERFLKLYTATQLYGRSPRRLLFVFAYSLLAQIFSICFLILAGEVSGLGDDLRWSTYFLVAPLGFMATAIPISPAGIGVGQAAFYFLFNTYMGHKSDLGPTTVTAFQMFQLIFGLIGIVFYLQRKDKNLETSLQDLAT